MRVSGVAHAQVGSPVSGHGLSVTGDLGLVQRQPLRHKGRDERFSAPVFDKRSVFADAFDFAQVMRRYHERNGKVNAP